MSRLSGTLGCIYAFIAIALGAFGAHALKGVLAEAGTVDVWRTAVSYHMWHAFALVLCAMIPVHGRSARLATAFFAFGILLFSGSLYWLALGGPDWLGPITPLGGLSFMAGWIALAVALVKPHDSPDRN